MTISLTAAFLCMVSARFALGAQGTLELLGNSDKFCCATISHHFINLSLKFLAESPRFAICRGTRHNLHIATLKQAQEIALVIFHDVFRLKNQYATRNLDIPTHPCCIIPLITTRMQHEIYTLAFVLNGAGRWRSSRDTLVRAWVIFAPLFVHN